MKKILVLGSGFVAKPLITYLVGLKKYKVMVTGITLAEAKMATGLRAFTEALRLDVNDDRELGQLIKNADIVVSLLPYAFHARIARACIAHRKSMVTTSYAKSEIFTLDKEARSNNVLILKEMGLDPGLDHISAMKLIDAIKTGGGDIVSMRSYCGGFPAPEANDNPLHYKFSWSPKGVLLAIKGAARYYEDEKIIKVKGDEIDQSATRIRINEFNFEAYPNRDSLPYLHSYGIQNARTLVRYTLRYPGWTALFAAVHKMGLLDEEPVDFTEGTSYHAFVQKAGKACLNPPFEHKAVNSIEHDEIVKKMQWLDLFNTEKIVKEKSPVSPIDFLTNRMLEKMQYAVGERDMIVLYHDFVVKFPDRKERITSQLINYGDQYGHSAMSSSVAAPAVAAVNLILQGKIKLKGVQIPVNPEIYNPVMNELAKMGMSFEEKRSMLPD